MIHLTETGINAGRRLCLSDRRDNHRNVHAAYAPLNNPSFREQCCEHCLKVWAQEAYEDGDEMPEWVIEKRNF